MPIAIASIANPPKKAAFRISFSPSLAPVGAGGWKAKRVGNRAETTTSKLESNRRMQDESRSQMRTQSRSTVGKWQQQMKGAVASGE